MNKLRSFAALALCFCVALATVSCEDIFGPDDPYDPYTPSTPPKNNDLWASANPLTLSFPAEGGTLTTYLRTCSTFKRVRVVRDDYTKGWTSLAWGEEDSNGKALNVTASANDTGAERSGILYIYFGITDDDTVNAKDGNLDPERAALVIVTVIQASSGGGQSGTTSDGALSGLFSVSSSRKVQFSKGNLQYQASTETWRFANSQLEYIGSNNRNISSSYSDWIDLFGWGTSGFNCGNLYFRPYDCAIHSIDYYYEGLEYGPKGFATLTGGNKNSDWGVFNAISNGGNQTGLWRTLTSEEWYYLLDERKTASGCRMVKARVDGINGLIIFPDNWDKNFYSFKEMNYGGDPYSNNVVSASAWNSLEGAGCVFLPAAGQRLFDENYGHFIKVEGAGYAGAYWSASGEATESDASIIYFDYYETGTFLYASWPRCEGRSVRLVRNK